MSNHRGRFPGRPLSARRHRIRQRLSESSICNSNGANAFETARQIQRGLNIFRDTFLSSPSLIDSETSPVVRHSSYNFFGGSLPKKVKRIKSIKGYVKVIEPINIISYGKIIITPFCRI